MENYIELGGAYAIVEPCQEGWHIKLYERVLGYPLMWQQVCMDYDIAVRSAEEAWAEINRSE